jgi:hypothetical protein
MARLSDKAIACAWARDVYTGQNSASPGPAAKVMIGMLKKMTN